MTEHTPTYPEVRAAVHARLRRVPGIVLVLANEPRILQVSPAIYSLFAGLRRAVVGQQAQVTYLMTHRLCVKWVDNERAEEQLAELIDPVLAALADDPQLSGLVSAGLVTMPEATSGYMALGESQGLLTHRIVDYRHEVLVKGPAPSRRLPGQP